MDRKAGRKLRIIVLMHEDLVPPDTLEGLSEKEIQLCKTEYDVMHALKEMGHEVHAVGVYDDLGVIGKAIAEFKPHIAFNLLEEFHGQSIFDHHVVGYLELMKQPYTGCNPRGLMLAHDKALTKKILAFHRIRLPNFAVFARNQKVKQPKRLAFPLLVKSISEEGSAGISQASIVRDEAKLAERVEFIHRRVETDAIAEEYIEGRELYVGVIGNQRLKTYPVWEMIFKNLPNGSEPIATGRVKWNYEYQKKVGVITQAAKDLTSEQVKGLSRLSKRIYRLLSLTGYARLDYRMKRDGTVYLIEANPNPNISLGEDFAEAAKHCGVYYKSLLSKIITLGLSYRPLPTG